MADRVSKISSPIFRLILILAIAAGSLGFTLAAQAVEPQGPPIHAKLDSVLWSWSASDQRSAAEPGELGLPFANGRVQVHIVIRAGSLERVRAALAAAGGEITASVENDTLAQAWLPPARLADLAALPEVAYIRRPLPAEPLEAGALMESLAPMNASDWHAAGYQGAGLKIGVIDVGFSGYGQLLGSGLPASVTAKNFVDGETEDLIDGTSPHGTACAEVIHAVAPLAQLYLAKIGSHIDLAEAVAWLKDTAKVKIISTSLGWYNLAPGDGTGYFANLVQQVRSAGIVWVTAANNDRQAHWGGLYADPDGNQIHNFKDAQEVDFFGPGDDSYYLVPPGYYIRGLLRWDDWSKVNQDYDLYLLRWDGDEWQVVDSSTNPQNGGAGQTPTEAVVYISSGPPAPYGFKIVRVNSSRAVNFELFAPKIYRLDEAVAARSLCNLADAPAAITAAAIDVNSPYLQEPYSAEGPTNGPGGAETGGLLKPNLSGYVNVTTASYGAHAFNGTSAATPHVAGAAALVLSAYPHYTPGHVQAFLESHAIDLGPVGQDTRFGYGRVYLGPPPAPPKRVFVPQVSSQSMR